MTPRVQVGQQGTRGVLAARWLAALGLIMLSLTVQAASGSQAEASEKAASGPRIGVVDLQRLMDESPQAQQAKDNMAKRFAERKNALEETSEALEKKMDRLKQNDDSMSDSERDALSADIRDRQRKLTLKRSQYNDDVSDAEDKELKHLRSDLLSVIDAYAKAHGYDVILSNSVLYARPDVDVTDQILTRLRK